MSLEKVSWLQKIACHGVASYDEPFVLPKQILRLTVG